MKKLSLYLLLGSFVSFVSCDISDNESVPEDSFVKIFDQSQFETAFSPLDVKQSLDGGYVILSGRRIDDSNFSGIYVIKTDENGDFERESLIPTDEVHPVGDLMRLSETDSSLYFVGMNGVSLQAQLYRVNANGEVDAPIALGALTYPLAAAATNAGDILLLSYDNVNKNTVISLVNNQGNVSSSGTFTIGAGPDVEAPIIQHFNRTGRQLPFFCGQLSSGLYYFNGFYNFTLSLVFTDISGVTGVAQGQQDDGGVSSLIDLGGGNFSASVFNFGDNFIVPRTTISTSATTSSTDLLGNSFPELVDDAPVVLKSVEIGGQQVSVFGSNTRGGQIIMLGFDQTSGELLGTKYFGFNDRLEVSGFEQTEDGGLIIVGTTYVAGRFARVALIKVSAEQLKELG